jgi:L,D-peptidoglycan transpeptidase YkuD (ErfK/YbiS/YcfS/YnhG family)
MGQLIKVIAEDINQSKAKLFFFQNELDKNSFFKCDCVIGKNGLANTPNHPIIDGLPNKSEGDMRSPLGKYALGTAFGNDSLDVFRILNTQYPYLQNHPELLCVDDVESNFYNQIIDKRDIKNIDFTSAEDMLRADNQYILGVNIEYNCQHRISGLGSCIFMHVWQSPNQGTAGCIAISMESIKVIISQFEVGCEIEIGV